MALTSEGARQRIKQYDRRAAQKPIDKWERMAPYIAPSRIGILGTSNPNDRQTRNVYDSTTLMAGELMAQFIASQVINPGQNWLNYAPYGFFDEQYDLDEAREWTEECRDRSLKRHATSFFYAEGTECLIDFCGFGTGCLFGEEAPQPVNRTIRGFRGFYFHAEKTGRFCISDGTDGLVDEIDREYELAASKINELWGPEATGGKPLPEVVRAAIDKGNGDEKFKIIHSIYPRPKSEQGYGATGMPWASCWILHRTKELLFEGGYPVFPAAVPRYHKTPGEVFGRGRGDIAFPDTWTLNTAKRMGLEDWALKIRPPVLHRSDSIFGSLRLVPGGPTSVNTHGRPISDAVMPFQTGSHPEVSNIKEEELRKSIRNIYFVEQILQLMEVNKSEMTAFEFAKKINLLFSLLGPVYGRTEWEMLYRIAALSFATQMSAGDFSPPPPGIMRSGRPTMIAIEFWNPIARAQRSGDAEALAFALNDIGPIAQLNPDVLDRLDPDAAFEAILDIRGVPAKMQRNNKELADFRNAKAARNAKELALQEAAQVAGIAKDAAPALKVLQGGVPGGIAGVGAGAGGR